MNLCLNSCYPVVAKHAIVVCLLGAIGCSDNGHRMGKVSGEVSYEDILVPEGTVTFYPIGRGRPAIAQIQADGTYVLSTFAKGDGAPLGKYRVTIEARRITNRPPKTENPKPDFKPEFEWLVPQEYSSTESSDLNAIVEDDHNTIDFDL